MQDSIAAHAGAKPFSVSAATIASAYMRRGMFAILYLTLLGFAQVVSAQCISLTTLGSAYTQNFDTLSNSAGSTTNNLTIPGWFMTESGGGARDNEQYAVDTGASATGDTYSYGAAGSTERALGALRSGTLIPLFGACFTNNTGATITSLSVAYVGEEWRLGTAGRTDEIDFSYSTNATDLSTGTWTPVSALNFVTPDTATTGAKNGNAASERTSLSSTISSLSIAPGATVWIRWTDLDASGADDGLAVDDFSLTPQGATGPTLNINDVSHPEGNSGTTTFTFTVSLTAPAPAGGVTFDIATADGTATAASGDYVAKSLTGQTIPAGSSTYTFDVLVNGDTTIEPNETFFVNVTNITAAIAGDTQGQGTIVDDDAPPTLSINNVTLPEGNSGTTPFNFTVTLSATPTADVTVQYTITDGTATFADNDFAPGSGQVFFAAGTTTLTQTVTVLVIGDTKVEPDETFSVVLSSPVNATITPGGGIGTILNDDVKLTPIHDIQGNGATSPIVGTSITTRGIVTGVKSNGFFIQESDDGADADPNTSEGIFVFTSSAPPATAVVGNLVQVAATVQEYIPSADPNSPSFTELVTPTITLVSTGNPLPTPVVITANDMINDVNNLEKYEGMRVSVTSLTTVTGTAGNVDEVNATATSNGVFYGVLTGTPRPFREPGVQVPDPLPAGSPCCVPRFDANPERLRVASTALGGAAINISTGAVLTNLVGPLDYAFRTYTIDPDASTPPTVTPGMAVTPTAAPLAGEVTIASFNLERFFDTVNDPATSDVTLTLAAFNKRLTKASLAIRNFLHSPDIVGVEEMENLTTLQALAGQISSDAIAASQPDPQYIACLVEGNDIGGIDVGFLVKAAAATATTHHVEMLTCTQYNKNSLFVNPDSSTALLNDRPPLELVATVSNLAGDSFPVTVYVNHLRSLNGQDDPTVGSNGWPTEGARVRAKRQAQAVELANLIQNRQTNFPTDHIVVLGDFNAFDVNDGYGDSMGVIAGTPAPDNQTVVSGDGTSPVSPALTNLSNTPPPAERYSYTFDGNAQSIDHILISATLSGITHRLEHARIDADFPETLRGDATTPARISDHDPALMYLDALPTSKVAVTQTAAPDPVAAGANITYTIGVANNGVGTAGNVSLTDTLPATITFVSLTSPAGWSCTTPAVGANGAVSCSIASLAASANAQFTLVAGVPAGTVDGTTFTNVATATVGANDDGSGPLSATAAVDVLTPVTGTCGNADGGTFTTLASDDPTLCSSGSVAGFTGSGPWSWMCNGSNGGDSSTCSAHIRTWKVSTILIGTGGTISAPAQTPVNHGSATTFTVAPLANHSIGSVTGDTCTPSVQSGSTWTTGPITADCTISASFTADPVNGACGSDNGQTLLAAPTNLCSTGTATAVTGSGHPWTWSCNGSNSGGNATCSATIRTWSVDANVSGSGGSIAAPTSRTVDNGASASFTAVPSQGYSLASAAGCGATVAGNTITTAAITANCSVSVTFSANPVNGACGSDNGLTLSAAPTNLCSAGTATAVVGNGPWTWSCQGTGSGTTANCSANATVGSIAVLGGGTPIVNGDTSPSAAKGTDFGNVTIGTEAAHGFAISNPSSVQQPTGVAPKTANAGNTIVAALALPNAAGDLVVSGITSSNPAFTIAGGTGTVAKGGTTTFTVTFSASTVGTQNATIRIASNDAAAPNFTFAVTANAVAAPTPGVAVPAPALDAKTLLLLIAVLAAAGGFILRRKPAK
jgi:uncharacterized repeat protein (TIGR01451 family)